MPEAPQLDGPQVRSAPVATPRLDPGIATPDAFGAAAAQGLGSAAFSVTKQKQEADERRDDTNALDARLRYLDARNEDLASYQQAKLKDAVGLPGRALADHEKRRDEVLATLDSEGAKETFRRMAAREWVREDGQVTSHAAAQVQAYEIGTGEATIEQLRQQAIDSGGNPQDLDEALRLTVGARARVADLRGEDAQTLALRNQADRSAIYSGVVQTKLSQGDFLGARAFYEANKQHLDADARKVLENDTREGAVAAQAQATSDIIMRTMDVDRTKAMEQVASIEDAQLRERTRVNVQRAFADRDAARSEAQGRAYERLAKKVEAGASLDQIAATNPAGWNVLTQRDRDALRGVEQDAIRRKSPAVGSDRAYIVRNEAAEYPEEFMARDLRKERGQMAESDRARLMELQADMRTARTKGKGASSSVSRGFLTVDSVARTALREIGINPNVVDDKVDPRASRFLKLLDMSVEAAGGADKVTNAQVREMADRLLLEHSVPDQAGTTGKVLRGATFGLAGLAGIGVDGTKQVRAFDLPDADKMAFTVEQVPASDRQRARAALVAKGIKDPTDDQILQTYHRATAKAP